MRQMCGELISSFGVSELMIRQWYLCGYLHKKKRIIRKWNSRFVVLTREGSFDTYESH